MFESTRKLKTTFRGERESSILVELEFRGVVFSEGKKTGEPEKNLGIIREPAAKSTHIRNRASMGSQHRTRATLGAGEGADHCTNPVSLYLFASISGYQYTKTEF